MKKLSILALLAIVTSGNALFAMEMDSDNLYTIEVPRPEVYQIMDALTDRSQRHWPTIFNTLKSLKGTVSINDYKSLGTENTLLILAVYDGNFIAAKKLLVEYNAYPNVLGKNNITALMKACENNDIAIVKLLLHHGADASIKNLGNEMAIDYCSNQQIRELLLQN